MSLKTRFAQVSSVHHAMNTGAKDILFQDAGSGLGEQAP